MPPKRKNVQNGNKKNSRGKKTKVESNPEERFQQNNDGNTNERISCKCNKLWEQNRLLAHIKRDSNCRAKYTEEEIEAIKKGIGMYKKQFDQQLLPEKAPDFA